MGTLKRGSVLIDFAVDASDAGDGNLEIHVTADGESVPNYVRQERDANFRVTFTPKRPTRHKVNTDVMLPRMCELFCTENNARDNIRLKYTSSVSMAMAL